MKESGLRGGSRQRWRGRCAGGPPTRNADGGFERARQRQPDGNGTLGGSEYRELIQETG